MPLVKPSATQLALKAPKVKKAAASASAAASSVGASVAAAAAAGAGQAFEFLSNVSQPKDSQWCWAACAVMVGDFLNVSPLPDVQEVVSNTPGRPSFTTGLSAQQIRQMYRSGAVGGTAIDCAVMGPASKAQLDDALDIPVPVEFAVVWNGGGGHVMLIVGSDPGDDGQTYYYINDPDPNTRERTVTFQGLMKAFGKGRWNETIGGFSIA